MSHNLWAVRRMQLQLFLKEFQDLIFLLVAVPVASWLVEFWKG